MTKKSDGNHVHSLSKVLNTNIHRVPTGVPRPIFWSGGGGYEIEVLCCLIFHHCGSGIAGQKFKFLIKWDTNKILRQNLDIHRNTENESRIKNFA